MNRSVKDESEKINDVEISEIWLLHLIQFIDECGSIILHYNFMYEIENENEQVVHGNTSRRGVIESECARARTH